MVGSVAGRTVYSMPDLRGQTPSRRPSSVIGGFQAIEAEVASHGPVRTWARVMRGEVGGPATRRLVRLFDVGPGPGSLALSVVVLPFTLAAALLLLAEFALHHGTVVRLAVLSFEVLNGIVGISLAYVAALRPTRGRLLRAMRGWSWMDAWLMATIGLVLPTVAFAAVTALAVHGGLLASKGPTSYLAFRTFELFSWNLLDVIPVLKVPSTLNWTPSLTLPTVVGGAVVLIFKIALVLPLAQVLALVLKRAFGEGEPEAASKEGTQPPDRGVAERDDS
jgi:hypothetical protein